MTKKILLALLLTIILLVGISNIPGLWAYVASSPNFRMEYDSLNNEGGTGDSANFGLEDTMGEDAIGISSSDNYKIKAGFQHMQEVNIATSSPDDIIMPSIGGLTGGTSTSTATWTITTDNPGGYTLSILASTLPAMQSGGNSIANYTPADANVPDFNWSVAASDSEFGFSPESTDLVAKFKDNGFNTCATGSSQTTDKCWYNFKTTNETLSQSTSRNDPGGTATNVKLKAEVGAAKHQLEGTYTAELTITAVVN